MQNTDLKKCSSCWQGEIDSREDNTPTTGPHIVRNPDDGKIELRGYLCKDHMDMYLTDGYTVN